MKILVKRLDWYIPSSEIFTLFHEYNKAVFLDSSLKNDLGRYSIIGINPYLEMKEQAGKCFVDGNVVDESLEKVMKQYLLDNKEENETELPFISGAIGYFSYDYGRKFEDIKSCHEKQLNIPEAYFCFYDNYIIEDCHDEVIYVVAGGKLADARESMKVLISAIKGLALADKVVAPVKQNKLATFQANFEKEDYKAAVQAMIDYIVEGDIYIANMTQQLIVDSEKAPYNVFEYMRIHNPSPFGSYFNYQDFQIVSASPERFLSVREGLVETRPIKGTRKRGETPKEDAALKEELQLSEKDRSELLMIVDLLRNDLSRACEPNSVQVKEHFAVETYTTVFHLVTTIVGKLREDKSIMDLIKAAFPGGSITGAPKIRAMEIIDELEHGQRGLYTGSIGYLGLDGNSDLNIVIRTAVYQAGQYHIGAGGGITCESETEFEYEETLQKARAVLEAIYDGEN
jgi:aminodeoxychorismate synthase, component I, bacterial clade